MKHVIFIFERAILIKEEDEDDFYSLSEGNWPYPFPNTKTESTAYGLYESFVQSENGFCFHEEAGEIKRIIVSNTPPEFNITYTANKHYLNQQA